MIQHIKSLLPNVSMLTVGCLLLLFTGCDTLTEDAQPVQQFDDLNLVALPNSSAVVNLSEGLESFGTVTLTPAQQPDLGSLSEVGRSIVRYRAPRNFIAGRTDQFTYNVFNSKNELLGQRTYSVNLVGDTTELPCGVYAFPDSVVTGENQPIVINVLENDIFCSLNREDLVFGMDLPASHGLTEVDYPVIRYYPLTGFRGTDQLVYTLMDKDQVYATALVTIIVDPSNLCPFQAIDDKYDLTDSTTQVGSFRLSVQLNDQRCNDSIAQFRILEGPQTGSARIEGDELVFTSVSGDATLDSIRYEICASASGLCSEATVTIKLK